MSKEQVQKEVESLMVEIETLVRKHPDLTGDEISRTIAAIHYDKIRGRITGVVSAMFYSGQLIMSPARTLSLSSDNDGE